MTTSFSIAFRDTYVEVRSAGLPDRETAVAMWTEIAASCNAHDCYDLLVISDSQQPMKRWVAFDLAEVIRDAGFTSRHRAAWVELNPDASKATAFVETVVLNRGLINGQRFDDIESAREWLTTEPR